MKNTWSKINGDLHKHSGNCKSEIKSIIVNFVTHEGKEDIRQ